MSKDEAKKTEEKDDKKLLAHASALVEDEAKVKKKKGEEDDGKYEPAHAAAILKDEANFASLISIP